MTGCYEKLFSASERKVSPSTVTNASFHDRHNLEFFGYVFSGKGLSADPTKVEAITNVPSPTNVAEVRSLLGMANYCFRLIPECKTLTQPLRELPQRDSP